MQSRSKVTEIEGIAKASQLQQLSRDDYADVIEIMEKDQLPTGVHALNQ